MTSPQTHRKIARPSRIAVALTIVATALLILLPTAAAAPKPKVANHPKAQAVPKAPPAPKVQYPRQYVLTNNTVGHWATVVRTVGAHAEPSASSKTVAVLSTVTGDGTQNLVLILSGIDINPTETWYHVRLPILPNNSTGWVPRSALGTLTPVYTHLYVDRETDTLTLKKEGRTIFTSRVGVGTPSTPTPAGQFYIRDKLTDFHNPFYGPVAFGTSARSAVLTEWPGGGFIGVHGTNTPNLIPGDPSHGCVRLVNSQILKLAKLIQVGTPLTIT